MNETALHGTLVLDLSEGIAGPYCAKLLAAYGAEVIKIEPPAAGDRARRTGPFLDDIPNRETSALYQYLNTGKKGVTLNLNSASGRHLLLELVQQVDVLVESFLPGTMDDWQMAYADLEQFNPGLVMVSVTPFGQSGPYRCFRTTDIVSHAMGGWLYAGGSPDHEPLKPGGSLAEYTTGLVAAVGCMTALWHRNLTGEGQQVDISAMEALLSTTPFPTVRYSFSGQETGRSGHPYPFTILPCKDGYIGVNILTQPQWEAMCRFMGLTDLLDDPRFATGGQRQQPEAVQEITRRIQPWLLEHTAQEVLEGQKQRVPFALVPTTADLLDFPQHRARGFFVEIDHPVAGRTMQPGPPFKLSESPARIDAPAPTLGQHNQEVYCGRLGYSKHDLITLSEAGII